MWPGSYPDVSIHLQNRLAIRHSKFLLTVGAVFGAGIRLRPLYLLVLLLVRLGHVSLLPKRVPLLHLPCASDGDLPVQACGSPPALTCGSLSVVRAPPSALLIPYVVLLFRFSSALYSVAQEAEGGPVPVSRGRCTSTHTECGRLQRWMKCEARRWGGGGGVLGATATQAVFRRSVLSVQISGLGASKVQRSRSRVDQVG